MKRTLRPEEAKLWSLVAATVRPVVHARKPEPKSEVAPGPLVSAAAPAAPLLLPLEALVAKRPKPPPR